MCNFFVVPAENNIFGIFELKSSRIVLIGKSQAGQMLMMLYQSKMNEIKS